MQKLSAHMIVEIDQTFHKSSDWNFELRTWKTDK